MKKILVSLISVFAVCVMNCAVLDPAGISDSYKGSEARQKIKDAAFTSDLLYYSSVNPPDVALQITQLDGILTNLYLKIDDSKYYDKSTVDKCVKDVQTIGLLILDASTTVLTSKNCNDLKANGPII